MAVLPSVLGTSYDKGHDQQVLREFSIDMYLKSFSYNSNLNQVNIHYLFSFIPSDQIEQYGK